MISYEVDKISFSKTLKAFKEMIFNKLFGNGI
jgi:hypothetical protein